MTARAPGRTVPGQTGSPYPAPPASGGGPVKVVAFGGGHGLGASLRALRACAAHLELDITAVVTVGDDGGSSGRLRRQRGGLPPGDLRQALVALSDDDPVSALTARLFQYRYPDRPAGRAGGAAGNPLAGHVAGKDLLAGSPGGGDPLAGHGVGKDHPVGRAGGGDPLAGHGAEKGLLAGPAGGEDPLAGHAVGNLFLGGLMEMLGDPVAALDHAAAVLRAGGRVLPMACQPVSIEADVVGVDPAAPYEMGTVRGQHEVAVTPGRVISVRIAPPHPPACPQAVAAVLSADWLIFGPGSWYTSVIPHLLVPDLAAAIAASPAARLVTLNLAAEPETLGLSLAGHLAALREYLPELMVDMVLADGKAVGDPEPVRRAAESLGARLVLAPLAVADGVPRHDPGALGAALVPVLAPAR